VAVSSKAEPSLPISDIGRTRIRFSASDGLRLSAAQGLGFVTLVSVGRYRRYLYAFPQRT
jgi:hypothetical protein